jgi:hypothetical protein
MRMKKFDTVLEALLLDGLNNDFLMYFEHTLEYSREQAASSVDQADST